MDILVSIIAGLLYNYVNMIGLYGAFFLREVFGLL